MSTGRSHFLIAYPSLYILLCYSLVVVGHRKGDFDFRRYLSRNFPCVYNIPFCSALSDQVALFSIMTQPIHQPEEDLVVRIDLDPYDALCTLIASNFLA